MTQSKRNNIIIPAPEQLELQGILLNNFKNFKRKFALYIANELESKCSVCEKYSNSCIKEPLIGQNVLSFEQVGMDILAYSGSDYLALEDYYSKWLEIKKLKIKLLQTSCVLKEIFTIHGVHRVIVCDNVLFGSFE